MTESERGLDEGQERYLAMRLVYKWGYDPLRASEYHGHTAECTPKQAKYIRRLSEDQPNLAYELERLVNLFNRRGCWNALTACTKGQAMFVIKCFLGQIRPREWLPDDDWTPWA